MKKDTHRAGFTLIEVVVVAGLISIASSIVLGGVFGARERARDVQRQENLRQIANAVSLYFSDNGSLPRNADSWCSTVSNETNNYGADFQADLAPYIASVPRDPKLAGQQGDYLYYNQNNTAGYFTLCANLETATGDLYDYTGCAAGATYNYCVSY